MKCSLCDREIKPWDPKPGTLPDGVRIFIKRHLKVYVCIDCLAKANINLKDRIHWINGEYYFKGVKEVNDD